MKATSSTPRKGRKRKDKKVSIPHLQKKVWKVFSEYVRRRAADAIGYVNCVTCGNRYHWKKLNAGHAHPGRQTNSLRFDERAVAPQCVACNRWGAGMTMEFALVIRQKYSADTWWDLCKLRRQSKTWTHAELEGLLRQYQAKLDELPPTP